MMVLEATDRELLDYLYGKKNYELSKIADLCECTKDKAKYWKNKYGIKRWYKREDKLQELYIEKDLDTTEVKNRLNCSHGSVSRWLNKHNIQKESAHSTKEGEFKDKEWLRGKYHDENMTLGEIGQLCGVSARNIGYWCEKHGIELRQATHQGPIKNHATYRVNRRGYPEWSAKVHYPIHRLLAVSEFGVEAVKENVVHHKNGITWDNRPENIEVVPKSEHWKIHHERGDFPNWEENLEKGRA